MALRVLLLVLLAIPELFSAPKFYPDDPLRVMPPPIHVETAKSRKLNDYYDFFLNLFLAPGELQRETGSRVPSAEVNTLDEVPDSAWYTNRHYYNPMSIDELVRGPGQNRPPSMEGEWTIVAAKTEGVTPGFTVIDSKGLRYIIKFDPIQHPEIATAADVISSKFFHALGYNVPENYLVRFDRDKLRIGSKTLVRDKSGVQRPMNGQDVYELLRHAPRNSDGTYRAVASRFLEGKPLGPFRYHGTRRDDPNDIDPHEHRRDLRGLRVFASWLNHDDSRAINTLDMLVTENGRQFIRHYLIDFGSTLGSASYGPNSPRSGFEYLFAWKPAAAQFFSFGLYAPKWHRAKYAPYRSVGRFESKAFDADEWVPEYPNSAFVNQNPDDAFWAAKQVMAFTDEQIRAMVETGQYSQPGAAEWVTKALIERRDKIGRDFLTKVLPLDQFRVDGGRLRFEDLAVRHKLAAPRDYRVQWSRFDNETRAMTPLAGAATFDIPRVEGHGTEFRVAELTGPDPQRRVLVTVRYRSGNPEVVGIERTWPEKGKQPQKQ